MASKTIQHTLVTRQVGDLRVEYVLSTFGANGKLHTTLRRWAVEGGFRTTDVFGGSRTLAVQRVQRITTKAVLQAHQLGAGDVEAVRLALGSIAAHFGEIPCPTFDADLLRRTLAGLTAQAVEVA